MSPRAPLTALLQMLRPLLPRRWCLPRAFDPAAYLAQNPDVAAQGRDPALHFLRHGRHEGRAPCALRAQVLEAALWAGVPGALVDLQAVAVRDTPEAAWAALALARWAAMSGNWAQAGDLLVPSAALVAQLGLPDPLLLRAEMALRTGQAALARTLLAQVRRQFGPHPALALLQAAQARAGQDRASWDRASWDRALAPLYAPAGLRPPDFDIWSPEHPHPPRQANPEPVLPRVSVILPVRDMAGTIDLALAGLAGQSFRAFEVLVVENGSRDDTRARTEAWAARDTRIRVIRGAARLGAYGARNLGAAQARGEFLALHDGDDWSHPERLARQVQALCAHPAAMACLPHWVRMTPDAIPALWRPDLRAIHPALSMVMLRRSVLDQIGMWDCVRMGADTEFIDRMRHAFGPASVIDVLPGVPLGFGRVLPHSLSHAAATGLQGAGAQARKAYLAAARDWHQRHKRPFMPQHDGQAELRPFPAPPALGLPPLDEVQP